MVFGFCGTIHRALRSSRDLVTGQSQAWSRSFLHSWTAVPASSTESGMCWRVPGVAVGLVSFINQVVMP